MEFTVTRLIIVGFIFIFVLYVLKMISKDIKYPFKKDRRIRSDWEVKSLEEELKEEAKKREDAIKKVTQFSKENPQKTASILTNFFLKGEDKDKMVND
ncbi:hypothetical protein ACFL4T_01895 [candidate division KSB1 bacterium]